MEGVIFLDSSILLNILDVPQKNSDRATVLPRFQELYGSGSHLLVIPMAAVLEVGTSPRSRTERFAACLRSVSWSSCGCP